MHSFDLCLYFHWFHIKQFKGYTFYVTILILQDDLKGQNRLNQEQTEVTTQSQATSPDNPELATESEKVPQEGETEDQQVKSESKPTNK